MVYCSLKYNLLIVYIVLIGNINAQEYYSGDSCCVSRFKVEQFDSVELIELTSDFKRLSTQGTLCCDELNSDLFQIMDFFAKTFGEEGVELSEVLKYMGMPDGTDKELYDVGIELDAGEEALMYCWRSYHDFLYFVYEDNKIKYAKWYNWTE